MPEPKIGQLRHRAMLQEQDETQNSYGEENVEWSDVSKVWVMVEPLSGQELIAAQQVQGTASHSVWMRYRSDLTVTIKHRLVVLTLDDLTLNIASVVTVGPKIWFHLTCVESET